MNGLKVTVSTDDYDQHTFLAPSNVVIPDTVGMYFFDYEFFLNRITLTDVYFI